MSMTNYASISDVKLGHKLGNGNFGEVYMGQWKVRNFMEISMFKKIKGTDVALKKLKASNSEQIEEFVKESQMLSYEISLNFLLIFTENFLILISFNLLEFLSMTKKKNS